MYDINPDIPGWTDPNKLYYLASVAEGIGENKTVVEIGSFYGRATYALGTNKRNSTKLVTIDPFSAENATVGYGQEDIPFRRDIFDDFCKDIRNMHVIQGHSPSSIQEEITNVSLLYIDLGYASGVKDNLEYWFEKGTNRITNDAIVLVNDYGQHAPGVVECVNDFVEQNNLYKEIINEVSERNLVLVQNKFWEK